jgi:resuscitation-promoting factor RpfB
MKTLLRKHKKWLFPSAIALILIGLAMIYVGLNQTVVIFLDGEPVSLRSPAFKVSDALCKAGINLTEQDRVTPEEDAWMWNSAAIVVETAYQIQIRTPQDTYSLKTVERIPANLLGEVGIALYPKDRVLVNGANIDPNEALNRGKGLLLQYQPAIPIRVVIDDHEQTLFTDQATLGAALEAESIALGVHDWISKDLSSPVHDSMLISIHRAKPVRVAAPEGNYSGLSAGITVGEALLDLGLSLQHLDYSIPADDEPLPPDGEIRLVRVNETLTIATEETPHDSQYQEDPQTPLDQVSVIEPGQNAIFVTRERVRFENGQEVWRDVAEPWQASEAKTATLGYGSKIVVQTEVVDGQTLEYFRKLTVYATAYSPCKSGVDRCLYGTASGLPVDKGVVAVTVDWFLAMRGQRVYIPGYGYGVIADTGGGIPGRPWIDLAYTDETYQSWNRWTTMYFLTPVPNYVPLFLQ